MHNAISPLPEKDAYKLYLLIEALKRINKNWGSTKTTKILNEVEKYLNRCWTKFNTDDLESSPEEPGEWLQTIYKWLQHGFDIHTEINDLKPDQKKELLALGYFLQGELSTEQEFDYIREVLHSYWEEIKKFRSSP